MGRATKFPGGNRAWNVSGGGMSTSYWGLHGAEDLGNGYKAIFTLESFFRAQNGQFGRFQATRSSHATPTSASIRRTAR